VPLLYEDLYMHMHRQIHVYSSDSNLVNKTKRLKRRTAVDSDSDSKLRKASKTRLNYKTQKCVPGVFRGLYVVGVVVVVVVELYEVVVVLANFAPMLLLLSWC
jgi:hypothetical protein